jgi:transcription-repair coupling factor (superfamily II helicase)
VRQLLARLAGCEPVEETIERLAEPGHPTWVEGLEGSAKSYLLAGIGRRLLDQGRTLVILAPDNDRAESLYDDLTAFLADAPKTPHPDLHLFPALDVLLYDKISPDANLLRDRLSVFRRLLMGLPSIVVTTPTALFHRTLPPVAMREALGEPPLEVAPGVPLPQRTLADRLVALGYEREEMVEGPGQFSLRGGLIDVYPSTALAPLRIEYFGDEIESLRWFEVGSQRSSGSVEREPLLPAREVVLTEQAVARAVPAIEQALAAQQGQLRESGEGAAADTLRDKIEDDLQGLRQRAYFSGVEYYLPFLHPQAATLLDYLPADAAVAVDEPGHIVASYTDFQSELNEMIAARLARGALLPQPESLYLPIEAAMARVGGQPTLWLSLLPSGQVPAEAEPVELHSPPVESFSGRFDVAAREIAGWQRAGDSVGIATHQPHRVAELLAEAGVGHIAQEGAGEVGGGDVLISPRRLQGGFRLPALGLAVLTDDELFGWQKTRRRVRPRPSEASVAITSLLQLKEGDYVVHINHGIGQYLGLVRRSVQGVEREYLLIRYDGPDRLYVPVDQIDRVQKYLGGEDHVPAINRLSGNEWERTKRRARKAARELAKDLLEVQAARQSQRGHAFTLDQPWQSEMESAFPYEETPDQRESIQAVKRDMESEKPMDRLICGDVGFGKTEVAVRAAFKSVLDDRQVAVLVPTTVLAQQHYATFQERLGAYPIKIEMLSRFKTRAQQLKIVDGLRAGTVDIVIGTHRLLSKDIAFKRLGLVIIDEEQRFGVTHKERLKTLRATVDVLTMTATPIPRTLHMALVGLRDMSVINDPPEGRMPIRTLAMEKDEEVIREAILREIDRGGQVYFLHNRVESIGHVAGRLQRLLPHTRIGVAHGQLHEDQLERIMVDFYGGEYDVLLCTTIIESGLDVPNVNTLVVDHAERFGLAQLYQLRGRVGRSTRQAYAYLTWTPFQQLTDQAEKRIAAIREFSDLGSGFKIALRDLEIRGAGNLLGPEQHGFMISVGFELYCDMISQAVKEAKGEFRPATREVSLDLPLDAFLPDDYVPGLNLRVELYRRMAAVEDEGAIARLRAEIIDRFGKPLPPPVHNLFRLIGLKLRCLESGIASVSMDTGRITMRFAGGRRLSPPEMRHLERILRAAPDPSKRLPVLTIAADRVIVPPLDLERELTMDLLDEVAARIGTLPGPEEAAEPERAAAASGS